MPRRDFQYSSRRYYLDTMCIFMFKLSYSYSVPSQIIFLYKHTWSDIIIITMQYLINWNAFHLAWKTWRGVFSAQMHWSKSNCCLHNLQSWVVKHILLNHSPVNKQSLALVKIDNIVTYWFCTWLQPFCYMFIEIEVKKGLVKSNKQTPSILYWELLIFI